MKNILKSILLILLSACFSCSAESNNAELDENGKVIFFTSGIHKYALKNDYGMMIFCKDYLVFKKTGFELYNQKEKTIFKTDDKQKFLNEIGKIPKGVILDFYDTCTVSSFKGFKDNSFFDQLDKLCKEKEIKLMKPWSKGDVNILCTCMSKGP